MISSFSLPSLKSNLLVRWGVFVGLGLISLCGLSQTLTPFTGNESISYPELIAAYTALSDEYPHAQLLEIGQTDIGEPLHLFVINSDQSFELDHLADAKVVLFINNGIHPGEPCGVDASLKLARNLLTDSELFRPLLDKVTVCIVPMYNVGGALNRGCCSRANQNGPDAYGFRGNARNLDLNRDFIKCDSRNAEAFSRAFSLIGPHIMVDTHTSNGADYQYTMTMITSQCDKATRVLGNYMKDEMNPAVYEMMKQSGWEMTPYVHTMGRTPETGILDFLETPRYSTGYAALHNCMGFTSETHMFKPFADRVESTYQFELALMHFAHDHADEIILLKRKADKETAHQKEFALQWELDTTQFEELMFKGFEHQFRESEVTGKQRLAYLREKPSTFPVKYYNRYKASVHVEAPEFYIVPQAWREVIERLQWNGVEMFRLEEDMELQVEAYHIAHYESQDKPYEGHYLHHNVQVETSREPVVFHRGDYVIPTNQAANRLIVETLEPQGVDSYFAWNFFDSMLQQKEWFSDYVFEDKAEQMLLDNPDLREEFEEKRASDSDFASNHWWQLYWLYQHSDNYEHTFNRYPVFRFHGAESDLHQ